MKQPHNKLPWKEEWNGSLFLSSSDGKIGKIFYASDFEYILEACNNYQEAVKTLMYIKACIELDGQDYTDGEILDLIIPKIDKFLNKINDENTK